MKYKNNRILLFSMMGIACTLYLYTYQTMPIKLRTYKRPLYIIELIAL